MAGDNAVTVCRRHLPQQFCDAQPLSTWWLLPTVCSQETGVQNFFSADITANDPNETVARGTGCQGQPGHHAENCAFLVDGKWPAAQHHHVPPQFPATALVTRNQ